MKNKNLIIGAIVLSMVVVLSIGTYAYWTITKSQDGANTLIGGCLNVDITEESAGINLEKTWPISDFDGMQLEGYTFTVTNYCDTPQDYRIDLDRLVDSEGRKEMSNEYLATLLDYGVPVMYEELETGETTVEDVKEKRVLAYDTVAGKVGDEPGSNTHTLRLWIDEESPVSEQGSTFLSRVEINAGQGIEKYYTPEECFTFDSSKGSITAYDVSCGGTDVVIPYNINNVAVTQIGNSAFKEKGLTSVELPRSVTTIGNISFQYNPTLEKVIFKDGLTSIGNAAFLADTTAPIEESKLSFIMFPETLTNIGAQAFINNCLKQVIIPDSVTSIGTVSFKNNLIENYIIGTGITDLPSSLFANNEIKHVIIPDNIISVNVTFTNNPIEKITIGKGLTTLGNMSFANNGTCTEFLYSRECYAGKNFLTNVYIPSNVKTIGEQVFVSATSDVTITVENPQSAMTSLGTNWSGEARVIFGEEPVSVTE